MIRETVDSGIRIALQEILPANWGNNLTISLAEPVEEGIIDDKTDLLRRSSFGCELSKRFWESVIAWTVVIKTFFKPTFSVRGLIILAKQLVVQEELEIILFLRWVDNSFGGRNFPEAASTISTPEFSQGIFPGSASL